jgi:hypothetical protein
MTLQAHEMHSSKWILGPTRSLYCENEETHKELCQLIEQDGDQELRPAVKSAKTDTVSEPRCDIGTHHLERFSDWMRLVGTIAFLKRVARLRGTKSNDLSTDVESYQEAEVCVLKCVQSEAFEIEIDLIRQGKPLKGSPIANLNPFIYEHGILRVGGRIINSDLTLREKKPLIVPGRHHIATPLVRRYHSDYHHQGRHITEGVVRAAGFWIIGSKRLVSSIIHKCITCRKLRGKTEQQIMADLPTDRVEPSPPFTNVGVDAFGPWTIVSSRTRGGYANSKRWAIVFTCLVTRAVHIELVEEMSSSAFINAVIRFTFVRGKVKIQTLQAL